MKQLNPIIEALDGIDENIALAAAKKRKMKKPLKIVIIAAAAALLMTTTATAATMGDQPLIKLNNKSYPADVYTYTDQNGWTIKTTLITLPEEYTDSGYIPVGEVRPVYNKDARHPEDIIYYDELGVRIGAAYGVSSNMYIFTDIEKNEEIPRHYTSFFDLPYRHQGISGKPDGSIYVDIWQDAVQAAQEVYDNFRREHATIDEKVEAVIRDGWDFGLPGYGGYKHPSLHDIMEDSSTQSVGSNILIGFDGLPSEVANKHYNYALDIPEGFTEKEGIQAITFYDYDAKLVTQQMFIYTLTDETSGKDVKFTVWRSAEKKEVYTDHFGFDYEYISLNNGTQARLHPSDNTYIAEFEKDGAAYAIQIDSDKETVGNVLKNIGLL